jgi:LPS sulfotransferase NodH
MKKFVLITTQRSGSTWIVEMLNSHSCVTMYSELFLLANKEKPTWAGNKNIFLWNAYRKQIKKNNRTSFLPLDLFRYLDQVYSPASQVDAKGFKLMYNQLIKTPLILVYLLVKRVSIIHLIRENVLDVLLSEKATIVRGMAHSKDGSHEKIEIHLEANSLITALNWKMRKILVSRFFLANLGLPYKEIVYEDMLSGKYGFEHILDFIGIDKNSDKLKATLQKLNKSKYEDLIYNYDEVYDILKNSKFHYLLNQKI